MEKNAVITERIAAITMGALPAGTVNVNPDGNACAVLSVGTWDTGDLAAISAGRKGQFHL